jgi:hypothetical protein
MKRCGFLALLVAVSAASIPAQAARTITNPPTQTSPVAPGDVDMGTTQTLTYTITNTASGTNIGERVYRVRFRLNGTCTGTGCTATLFTTASAAPANWTRTSFSTTSVTYTAATWADSIPSGSSLSFSVVVTAGKSTQDRTETLRDVRASFTTDTTFSNGISNAGTYTATAPGSWILQSLQITSIQTTNTSGVAVSAIAAGISFRIVITVKNISVATQNTIVANPSPPTATTSPGFGTSPGCSLTSTSPSPFNLAAAASGTITYTCTTIAANTGTVTYGVTDVRTGASVTSRSGTSNVLSVSPLSVGIAVTGPYVADTTCHFSGDTATFVMTVTNNTAGTLTSITPSALTRGGTSTTIGAFTGPATSCTSAFPLPVGGNCKYTWTAPVTIIGAYPSAGAKPTFFVTGSATANPGPVTSPTNTSNIQDVDGFVVTVAPTATNTDSTNQEFTLSVTNRACNNLNKVAITVPGGFTYGGDGYSAVVDTTGGANPNTAWSQATAGSTTTFTAPLNNAPAVDAGRMPIDKSGDFSLVMPSTPGAAATYTFSLDLTDENGVTKTSTVDVPVSTFGSGTFNNATPSAWREVFQ